MHAHFSFYCDIQILKLKLNQGFSGDVVGGLVVLADGRRVQALGGGFLVHGNSDQQIITGHK